MIQRGYSATYGVVAIIIALFALPSCGGSGSDAGGITKNAFANTYKGQIALRTADKQLSGNYASVNMIISTDNRVTGTVTVAPSSGTDSSKDVQPENTVYSHRRASLSRASSGGTVNITGTSNPTTGILTATGTGSDSSGAAITVTVQGTPQQLGTSQLATVNITVASNTTTTTGMGVVPGTVKTNSLPSAGLPPILTADPTTGDLKIPQGATVRFAPTGTDQPANPDQTETGDVVNFSIADYHSPDFDGYSNIDSGGWIFSYDGTYITIKVPDDAPITTGYEVRDRSTGSAVSANFRVVKPIATIFFGGFFDSTASHIVQGYVTDTFQPAHKDVLVMYYTFDNGSDALALINNMSAKSKINLVGHSYGGDTAASVATRAGRTINLLITIDPVSRLGPSYATIAKSSAAWYDVNATAGGDFSDGVAFFGNAWNSGPKKYIPSTYFEVAVHHGDFVPMLESNGIESVLDQASQ